MRRFAVGGDGTFDLFGKTWSWDSYFQHGETDTSIKIYNMPLSGAPLSVAMPPPPVRTNGQFSRFNLAQDAVFNRCGQIVCRNTIAQSFGCVPFNPFGGTSLTPGQIAYFDGQNVPGGTTIGPTAVRPSARKPSASPSTVRRSTTGPVRSPSLPVTNIAKSITASAADPYSGGVTRLHPGHRQRALHRSVRRLRPDHPGLAWAPGTRATITTAAVPIT